MRTSNHSKSRSGSNAIRWYGCGVLLTYTGFALAVRAGLGLGPLNVLQQGVSRTASISLGTAGLLTGACMAAAATALQRPPGAGTLMSIVGGAVVLDASLGIIPEPTDFAVRAAFLVASLSLMALGGAACISAGIGTSPADSLMLGIAGRLPVLSLGLARMMIEVGSLVIGAVLGGSLGIGTVIIGLGIGPGIQSGLSLLAHSRRSVGARRTVLVTDLSRPLVHEYRARPSDDDARQRVRSLSFLNRAMARLLGTNVTTIGIQVDRD